MHLATLNLPYKKLVLFPCEHFSALMTTSEAKATAAAPHNASHFANPKNKRGGEEKEASRVAKCTFIIVIIVTIRMIIFAQAGMHNELIVKNVNEAKWQP